ncbi:AzlD domain-containing protein [Pseudonocardiaceae bacterium YIM PH 21723]|nr:AzlD domain-containing protein [Pseudonocardiaceae bacterium YIM PH 21723]
MSIWPVLALAGGTFAIRAVGPQIRDRVRLSERATVLMAIAATTLLFALTITATVYKGVGDFAGWSRIIAVVFAGFLAWRKVPFALVVIAAAATAALLRLLGLS